MGAPTGGASGLKPPLQQTKEYKFIDYNVKVHFNIIFITKDAFRKLRY